MIDDTPFDCEWSKLEIYDYIMMRKDEGLTDPAIASALNSAGQKNDAGKAWKSHNVKYMRNRFPGRGNNPWESPSKSYMYKAIKKTIGLTIII